MELNGVSTPISPIQNDPIVQPQAESEPPESEPEVTVGEEGGGKADGVVSKLESGHFKGKGVSDVRLRIAHFDNPDLDPVDPDELVAPENGPTKAYEKFLEQYRALYDASLVPEGLVVETPPATEPDPDAIVEPLPEPDVPAGEIPEPELIIEGPVVETPPATEPDPDAIAEPLPEPDVPAGEIPEPEPIIEDPVVETPSATEPEPAAIAEPLPEPDVPAGEIPAPELIIEEPVVETPPATEPEPADESDGALAAFIEILEDTQAVEAESETLDTVI